MEDKPSIAIVRSSDTVLLKIYQKYIYSTLDNSLYLLAEKFGKLRHI